MVPYIALPKSLWEKQARVVDGIVTLAFFLIFIQGVSVVLKRDSTEKRADWRCLKQTGSARGGIHAFLLLIGDLISFRYYNGD